ncbi:PilZ domain-containing protein [Xanthomonas sp. XNM01]|uniref:PilZ domain-containing protein n=1 Tax=Xanthomonas sp. XNM01 TaxID=2769289 RepID=UPI0017800B31|nr:PilZ domain-containing protein [Xanthomonas sp. XNM01]MBD9367258.1 PilZ domain-containing protein [Xanthomonas sp. XNM01]
MINESRRAPRRNVAQSTPVLDTMTDTVVGHLGNLSESGMLLLAGTELHEDALYQFRFQLDDGGPPLSAGVHLLWLGAANTPGQSWCGFRFLSIADSERMRIRAWVEAGQTAAH